MNIKLAGSWDAAGSNMTRHEPLSLVCVQAEVQEHFYQ